MLDLVSTATAKNSVSDTKASMSDESGGPSDSYKTIQGMLSTQLDVDMVDRFQSLRAFIVALGDDVQETTLRLYIAFKRIKNFACVEFRSTNNQTIRVFD